jgi:DNA-binding response OmpR family regulator
LALNAYQEAELILLDLELPDLDGLEVCRTIRKTGDIPIIMLTPGDTEFDKVLCLHAGADDCLVKPYGLHELLARMQAVLRRVRNAACRPQGTLVNGPLQIDPSTRQVLASGQTLSLTRKEFDLLHLLASQPGVVFSRKEIMSQIWGDAWGSGRTVDTHVSTLRNKLGDNNWILTMRGVGYRFAQPHGSAA